MNVISVLDEKVWESLTKALYESKAVAHNKLYEIQERYHIDVRNIIKDYLNYIIGYLYSNVSMIIDSDFLKFSEFILHLSEPNAGYLVDYFLENICSWDIKKLLS
jgi:hypothetical protein